MRIGILFSIIFHIFCIALFFLGFPNLIRHAPKENTMLIDVVPISEISNFKVNTVTPSTTKKTEYSSSQTPIKETKPELLQQIDIQRDKLVEKRGADEKITQQDNKEINIIKDSNEKIKKTADQDKEDYNKKEERKVEKVNKINLPEKSKIELSRKEDKKFIDNMKNILKSIEKPSSKKDKARAPHKVEEDSASVIDKILEGETNSIYNEDLPVGQSELSAIKSQITRAWNPVSFSGAAGRRMQVSIVITLNSDGTVIDAKELPEENDNKSYRAFVESTLRAVYSASPLKNLPVDKYNSWKQIQLQFDSIEMLG